MATDWYKDAVFYELHVRAFQDGNNDGRGDFRGLVTRLDYLKNLGVDCLWLLPFYPSPLKDDGYDIADFYDVHPDYGTLDDLKMFLEEAHSRGIRVIADMVVNHISDQHHWFQEARKGRDNPFHDYFVWSDTGTEYPDARIIFVDTEKSNWTWDPVCERYYWHRFFSQQPDLNYDNPAVRKEMKNVIRFWLGLGLDGFRVDAVPYLIEREGTNCENLPETHEYLRELRALVDEEFPGKVLLAEANQWPEDVVQYFGTDEKPEFHMCFHFPVMPRLFMALRREDNAPIREILGRHTPETPSFAQWAIFLRNHDELTLEMVTDEERDYMYSEYAKDPRMKINVGIRRRLAPLLDGSRRQAELLHALLFSLPGSPILYYGDEIGMGDNIFLGDRNGVRTPMQWSFDRNGGFSRADYNQLYSPVIADPVYGWQTINVESQTRNENSLLHWMRRMIQTRRRYPAFSRGDLTFLRTGNRKVLAFLRKYGEERLLVACNLSRSVQPCEIEMLECHGFTPVELMGETQFPPIGELPYFFTFGPHEFYWFRLEPPAPETHSAT
jgi:maltose alpha-D-glucosyltransferase / alpha-amylase